MSTNESELPEETPSHQRLSMTAENYLLSIYRLQEEDNRVTLTQLADHLKTLPEGEGLGTSLPTVGGMIRRLAREGLVETDTNKELSLTKKGTQQAESIVRRHRLAERLVVDLFDAELHRAHVEAHLLEHAISSYLESRIIRKLGHPTTSPFGYPIPGSKYVPNKNAYRLNTAKAGQTVLIDRIPEDDGILLKHLVDSGVIPGETVVIDEINTSTGIISFRHGQKVVVFGYEVGKLIWVCPVDTKAKSE